jgi:hypothetical protein
MGTSHRTENSEMKNAPDSLPAAILGGVIVNEEMEEETKEPESERLSQLPEHEDDRARGADGSSDDSHTGPDETS